MRKAPVTFTASVPRAKRLANRAVRADAAAYRVAEPAAPPTITIQYLSIKSPLGDP
jgi:hypothetical protein